jgi:hypothetical protein
LDDGRVIRGTECQYSMHNEVKQDE